MNVTYNNKPAIMRRNGQVVLGDVGGITFQFIALDIGGNELGATEQIKVESVSTETVTEVQATFVAKLAAPQNVTANGTTVSWDPVENATSYDVYADDTTLLGNVTSQSSVDLTTLSGWADLTDRNHIIKIVAKADGYIDSEKSAGVEVIRDAEPSLQLMDYQIVAGNFFPNDEIKLTNDRQFVKDIKNGNVKTFFDNQPYGDSVEAFTTLRLDNSEPSVYGNYLYTYEIITPFEFFVLKRDGAYTFEIVGEFTLTGTLKSPAFIGGKLDDFDEFDEPLNYLIMVIDLVTGKCTPLKKAKEIDGVLGTLKFDTQFPTLGLLGIIKRGNVLMPDEDYEFVATPDFEGLNSEAIIDCEGVSPSIEMVELEFNGITINSTEKSIIFPDVYVVEGEGDETDWGYKNGVWGYDKNGTRVADDRIRTVGGIQTIVALSDEAYAFWQKNTKIILEIPQNVTANGTTVSWDAVRNATSYDVYADDTTLLGNVTSQSSVDLTTLSGWADLTDGNHIIKIVAKAAGYKDSEKSAGVEVTK